MPPAGSLRITSSRPARANRKERLRLDSLITRAQETVRQVNRVILGKERQVAQVMLAFLADGHVLLEDVPGTGKTTLAMAFSRVLALDCRRVQFTPDVMPSDLTGFSVYHREEGRFVYQPGSVFCNLLLADELNRTSPKTQSALLEVMEEHRVSVEGVTREVPAPFLVVATQNPWGSAGTQPLPPAQVDRFLISLSLGYPDFEHELTMAMLVGEENRLAPLEPVLRREELLKLQRAVHQVYMREEVYRYGLELICATRNHPELEQGVSPRGTIALVKMAKASALLAGREFVLPEDVREQFPYVAAHRVVLSAAARLEHRDRHQVLSQIADGVKQPPLGVRPR